MTKKTTLLFGILMMILSSYAQPQPVGNLTIFSEDGDKFFLILNGERQNTDAQTNLRVEDLTQNYYSAKIIFEDKSIPEIDKKYLSIVDANGVKQDVTYKIKKNKNNGKITLNYFSMTPIVQGYTAPTNVYVVHNGTPDAATNASVTQTTTTTSGTNQVGATLNLGGINLGVTVTDPTMSGTVHTTTTTTHTSTYSESNSANEKPQEGCIYASPMGASNFSSALNTIKNGSFDETMLKTAEQVASGNCLSADQISEVCNAFGFEKTKLDFAKFAYKHCTEPNNYFKVNNVFGFSSSVDELNNYISGK